MYSGSRSVQGCVAGGASSCVAIGENQAWDSRRRLSAMMSRARIFIVDDHPLVRDWLTTLLKQQPDMEVCGQAEDAPTALAGMAAKPPDVAIVDLSLKGGSGLDLIKDLRLRHPDTAIIVLSMYEETHYAERALRAGEIGRASCRERVLWQV